MAKYLVHIVEEIAHYLGKDVEDLADEVYLNTCNFFSLKSLLK